jgi:hypothetical protein
LASAALLAVSSAAHAQIASTDGWVELSASWSAGPDISVGVYTGGITWDYAVDPANVVTGDYNYSDGETYVYSSGYSELTGPAWDSSGAENGIAWYVTNNGTSDEEITWTLNYSSFSQMDVNAGWGYDQDFADVIEYDSDYDVMFDITSVWYTGDQTQEYTDSVTYSEVLAPGEFDALEAYSLHRSELSYDTAAPGPFAAIPFGLAALAGARRMRRA